MNIVVVGLSHKTAPVEIREKLSIAESQIEQVITHLHSYPHIAEVAIINTCNRLEIYAVAIHIEQAIQEIIQFLSEHSQLSIQDLSQHLFTLEHHHAIRHLMQVAAGLDSLVIGEGQILAQVKHTHNLIQQYNHSDKRILNQLFKQAITAAKRVRTETSIGTGAVSVSSAAVELAQTKVDNLSNYRVTIVGAGNMARRLIQHLLAKKVTKISVVNRSVERAQELVSEFKDIQIECYPLTDMMSLVAASDLVFTSTSATEPLLDKAQLEAVLKPNQALLLFDISVPRNVNADVNELTHVQTFNVDDLKAVVAQNQESRRQMIVEAQALLEQELQTFRSWCCSRETVPVINCLRAKVETIREQEVEKVFARLGAELPKKHQEAVEALTRGIINKILHEPMVHLRSQQDLETQRRAIQTVQMLFNLENLATVQHPLDNKEQQYSLTAKTSSQT
ncbi:MULTISPECIES: glutamyl-tRNA reductase [Nostoc]|uniref:Glutamyl-tRNA reductase n=1 Tax=Nostoc paludosum FACHB-159 TaxID=2692908 RepID=A0ABR8KM00_9NOSO|nr:MULTISPECIES: glutamyl-tRNA reductase [Nostoc]MBD2682709.1 glutamyl-tRNA reductase [Nostoc sp. FACHB-857]MBD2739043.1 glutamyl-tRNA reductase [Nostoc paludosum FACHB-159]